MSKSIFSKNILREAVTTGNFMDQLKTIHAVAEATPAAQWTRSQIELKFLEAHTEGARLGYAEGYRRGEANGLNVGLENGVSQVRQELEAAHIEQIAAFSQDLQATLNSTQQGIEQWYIEAEKRLASLATEIARRAIGEELTLNSEAVVSIAQRVLQEVTTGNHIRLRVNPVQTATLDSRREEILQSISHIRDIEIVSDPSIQNGVIVESESGVVDGRIESYLSRIADHISEEAA
ncbi:MAG: FliH/SctL family protein [Fimbriimonadaceae bacterium]